MDLEQRMDAPKKHTLFYSFFIIMLFMVAVRNVLHVELPVVLFLGITVLIASFCEKDEIIAFSMACIPLSTAFQYKYALFIIIIIYCVRFSKKVKITSKVLPIVIMLVWEVLHFFVGDFVWLELLRGFAELIFLAFLFSVEEENFDIKLISKVLTTTTLVICFFILLIQLETNNYDFSKLFSGTLRFGAADEEVENFGLNFNENGLGGICNLAIIATLLVADSNKLKIRDIITVVLLAVFGAMTMSRTFLLCFIALMIYYFAFQKGTIDKKITRLIGILVIIVVAFFLLRAILPQVIENFAARFEESDITNGRTELLSFYNEHIFSSPKYTLFGIGMQDVFEKISELYSTTINVPHNGYIEIMVVWGLPGLMLFVWLIGCIIKKNVEKIIIRKKIQYAPLIFTLVFAMAGQLLTSEIKLLFLAFSYLCLNHSSSDFEEINNELY